MQILEFEFESMLNLVFTSLLLAETSETPETAETAETRQQMREITPINVTQSKTHSDNVSLFGPQNTVDKNFTTGAIIGEPASGPVWLKLEYDGSYLIHEVTYYSRFYTFFDKILFLSFFFFIFLFWITASIRGFLF